MKEIKYRIPSDSRVKSISFDDGYVVVEIEPAKTLQGYQTELPDKFSSIISE
jgi:hypothetical protein